MSEREAHYSDLKNASIKAAYSGAERIELRPGNPVYVGLKTSRFAYYEPQEPFAVSLNHSRSPSSRLDAWINVMFEPGRRGNREFDSLVVEVIDPTRIALGKTALLDALRMTKDDKIIFGSRKYPSFWPRIGLDNVELTYYAGGLLGVAVESRDTEHGSTLYTRQGAWDHRSATRDYKPKDYPKPDMHKSDERKLSPEALIGRILSKYPSLNAEMIVAITDSCRRIVREYPSKKEGRRKFEREFHPDSNPGLDPKVSHDRYLFAADFLNRLYPGTT